MRWQTCVGIALGLVAGASVLSMLDGGGAKHPSPPSGPVLSECDGHLSDLVIHYEPSARDCVIPVYRDFLGTLENDVTVHVVCPDDAAFTELSTAMGSIACKLNPVIVNHTITTWSRDRWVAMGPATTNGPTTVMSPRNETAVEVWPARAGDERVGSDLATALAPAVQAWRSDLFFDGGDFLADSANVFVMPRVMRRNLQHTVGTRDELLHVFACQLKRRIIMLDEAPDHHAGMFMATVGQRRMLVGDPSLAATLASTTNDDDNMTAGLASLPGGADFSLSSQRRFDAVAAQCAAAGYQVTRIPVVPGGDGRTYLTYANVVIDQQGKQRIVYLPYYRGFEPLNAAARAVWQDLGYQVRPVDCTSVYRHFGCLHCLVNVLRRAPQS